MDATTSVQQANMELVAQVGPLIRDGFASGGEHLFADDFVFHFFNPKLPELAGDHHGYDGLRAFFARLREGSDRDFQNEPRSMTPYGDELVVAYAVNTVRFEGTALEFDAVVVWRVLGGRIHEAWDIPAINTVRPHQPEKA